jgi:putative transposase
MKYQPTFPVRFASELAARAWLEAYFDWYHREHHHIGLALFTPEDVFTGRVEDVARVRQCALDEAFRRQPIRFPRGKPSVRRPPSRVETNPLSHTPPVELNNTSLN